MVDESSIDSVNATVISVLRVVGFAQAGLQVAFVKVDAIAGHDYRGRQHHARW